MPGRPRRASPAGPVASTSGFFGSDGRAALRRAARAIEATSAAEIIVAVAPAATAQPEVALAAGAVVAGLGLAAALYLPQDLALHVILTAPLALGGIAGLAVAAWPALRRRLSRRSRRVAQVQRAAAADFLARGVHHTRGRTGVLVYVALAERVCAVVADAGVVAAVPVADWRAATRALDEVVAAGGRAAALAEALERLAAILTPALPRRPDDVDELAAEVAA